MERQRPRGRTLLPRTRASESSGNPPPRLCLRLRRLRLQQLRKRRRGGDERPPREGQENGDDAPSLDAVVSRKSDGGEKEKEKGEKPNSLSENGGRKAMEKVMAIATATTTTKAASSRVEEGSKDVGSFGGKKKTAANDDIPSDVAGESPPLSSTMAESTATPLKAGPAGVVARGPRGGGGIPDDGGGKAAGGKDDAEEAGNTRRGRRG